MSNRKIKANLKLLLLCFSTVFLINSCVNDDHLKTQEQNKTNSPFNVSRIDAKGFEQNKTLKQTLETIDKSIAKSKRENANKTTYFSDYDFSINTDYSVYLENDALGYHSYTFKVLRDNTPYSLENLILSSNQNNGYDIYLSQYSLEANDIAKLQNGETPNLQDKAKLTQIIDETLIGDIFTKETIEITYLCPDVTFVAANDCGCIGHHTLLEVLSGVECQCFNAGGITLNADYTIFLWEECSITLEASGGEDTSSGSPGSGTDTTEDPNSGYDPTDPNLHNGGIVVSTPAIDTQDNDPHIKALKKIVEVPEVKAELNRLKNDQPQFSQKEDGKRYTYTGNNINDPTTYNDNTLDEQLPSEAGSDYLDFPELENTTFLGAHFHPQLNLQMQPVRKVPSGTDIAEHIIMVKKVAITNPTVTPNINQVTNFVVSDGQSSKTYAIRTNDEQGVVDLNGDFTKDGDERAEIIENLSSIILAEPVNDIAGQEEALVTYLEANFSGLFLIYVAVFDTNGNIINWIKL